jgi:hypothetical protein
VENAAAHRRQKSGHFKSVAAAVPDDPDDFMPP